MVVAVDRAREIYRKEYERNPVLTLFLTILAVFFIVFAAAAVISGGDTFYMVLNSNRSDVFSDYFDSIFYSSDRPYTRPDPVVYPPLVTLFYATLGHLTIPHIGIPAGDSLTAEMIKGSQMGIMSFFIITLLTFCVLYVIVSKLLKKEGLRKDLVFFFAILLAYPFVYATERGNSVLLALVFCFLFLLGYKSENKLVRYASYIALGCAAGIKLLPAILWLLILRDRDYREAGICALIVSALVFVPFIFTDGTPLSLLDNIFSYGGASLGFTNIGQIAAGIFQEILGFSEGIVTVITYVILGVFTLLSFIVILFDREMKFWKVLALIGCYLILGPGIGVQYQVVYMAMPMLYFLIAERVMTKENKFYAVCFAMMMVLVPGIVIAGFYPSAAIGAVESAFVIIVAVVILYEGLRRMYRGRSVESRPAESVA